MNITISARHEDINSSTKDYAFEKAQKFEKFYKLRRVEVIMDVEKENYRVEILVSPDRGNTIVGASESTEWLSAIDQASDKVERQLRKLKGKEKSHRVKKQKLVKETYDEKDDEITYEEVVDEMRNK